MASGDGRAAGVRAFTIGLSACRWPNGISFAETEVGTLRLMDLNKLTEKAQAALQEAQNIATRHQHQAVDVEHLGLALMQQEEGLVPRLFEKCKVAPDLLQAKLEEELGRIPRVSGDTNMGGG